MFHAILVALRPRTLAVGAAPVVVGSAAAAGAGAFRPLPAVAALLGAILIQAGTNVANDLGDAARGADSPDRAGPARAVASGLVTPRQAAAMTAATFALAAIPGAYLVAVGGWPIVAVGVLSILAGLAYTLGPWPTGYHGLGDVFVLAFFGPVAVCGTYYVQAGPPTAEVLAAGVACGALATAVLVVNNLRDRETDASAGKRTLAVFMGAGATRVYYVALIAVAYAIAAALARSPMGLLPMLTLPMAAGLIRAVWTSDGHALNPALARTAMLLLLFAIAWAPGMAMGVAAP